MRGIPQSNDYKFLSSLVFRTSQPRLITDILKILDIIVPTRFPLAHNLLPIRHFKTVVCIVSLLAHKKFVKQCLE